MSGSFNTKSGIIYDGVVVEMGAPEIETDPIFAQNMFYVNASLEVNLSVGQQLSGNIYLEGSNDLGNETPGIGTTSVTSWWVLAYNAVSLSTATPVMVERSMNDFAYRWFRFRYAPDAAATGGLEGKIRYTMKGW
jgi:hypothetical protein